MIFLMDKFCQITFDAGPITICPGIILLVSRRYMSNKLEKCVQEDAVRWPLIVKRVKCDLPRRQSIPPERLN